MVSPAGGSAAITFRSGQTSLRWAPTPVRVPPVPRHATKTSARSMPMAASWATISGPVVAACTSGLAGFSYWWSMRCPSSRARRSASLTAPLEPSAPGENRTSAPKASSSSILSADTLSGTTTARRYPRIRAMRARAIPVFPELGSMSRSPGRSRPLVSAAATMAAATLSLTEPVGRCHSHLAKIRTPVGDSRVSSTRGVSRMPNSVRSINSPTSLPRPPREGWLSRRRPAPECRDRPGSGCLRRRRTR